MDILRVLSESYWDSVLTIVGAGFTTYLIFKRTETHEPTHLVVLLLLIPVFLSAILIRRSTGILAGVLQTFAIYWSTILGSTVAYRLSPWHPLARYPGPLVCKISKFWFAFLSLKGKQHLYYDQLHAKYGDVVRVGPNELSIRDVDAVVPLMGPNGLPKGPFWDGRLPEHEQTRPMISIRNNTEHTRRRRPWTRAFNSAALKGYEVMITNRCLQLVETLDNQVGTVNLTKWISYFTYDFMNDLAFGGGSEMMRDGDVDGLWHLLDAGQKNAIFMSHVPWLGALFLRFPSFAEDLKAFRAHAQKRAGMRRKQGSMHKDLFHHLMDEDGVATQPPTVPEVISDGGLAIIAGSDTTSSALTNLFFFLLTNPVTYKRLQAEIDELGDQVMDYAKQAHMPYLNAAINESLRLLPPVLSGSQRAPEPGHGGRAVGPYYVPDGTSTFIPFYCLHRDPRYFSPLSTSFVPERWLPMDQQKELEPKIFADQSKVILNTDAFIPFSIGPSNCVGKNLAWMEMRMLVCLLMQKFEIRLEDGYDPQCWEADMLDYFVMMKGKLPVVLTHRK